MTIIAVKTFSGLTPKLEPRRLEDKLALTATWSRLDNRQLRAWKAPVRIMGLCGVIGEYIGSGGVGTGGTGGLQGTTKTYVPAPTSSWEVFYDSKSCSYGFFELGDGSYVLVTDEVALPDTNTAMMFIKYDANGNVTGSVTASEYGSFWADHPFMYNGNVYGYAFLFSNSHHVIYKHNPSTGVTSTVFDFGDLGPMGAYTTYGSNRYVLWSDINSNLGSLQNNYAYSKSGVLDLATETLLTSDPWWLPQAYAHGQMAVSGSTSDIYINAEVKAGPNQWYQYITRSNSSGTYLGDIDIWTELDAAMPPTFTGYDVVLVVPMSNSKVLVFGTRWDGPHYAGGWVAQINESNNSIEKVGLLPGFPMKWDVPVYHQGTSSTYFILETYDVNGNYLPPEVWGYNLTTGATTLLGTVEGLTGVTVPEYSQGMFTASVNSAGDYFINVFVDSNVEDTVETWMTFKVPLDGPVLSTIRLKGVASTQMVSA